MPIGMLMAASFAVFFVPEAPDKHPDDTGRAALTRLRSVSLVALPIHYVALEARALFAG